MSKAEVKIPKPESVKAPDISNETKSQLPEPSGWRILVAMPRAEEKTDGGIVKEAVDWLKSKKGSVKGMSAEEVMAQWEEESTVARAKNKDKNEKINKKDLGAQYNQQVKGALRDLLDLISGASKEAKKMTPGTWLVDGEMVDVK